LKSTNVRCLPIVDKLSNISEHDYQTNITTLAQTISQQILQQQKNNSPIDVELATINEYSILSISNLFSIPRNEIINQLNVVITDILNQPK